MRPEKGYFRAIIPDMENVSSIGDTIDDALEGIKSAAKLYLNGRKGMPAASSLESLRKSGIIQPDDGVHTLYVDIV